MISQYLKLCPPDLPRILRAHETRVIEAIASGDVLGLLACYRLVCRHLARTGALPCWKSLPRGWGRRSSRTAGIKDRVTVEQFRTIRHAVTEIVRDQHDRHLALVPVADLPETSASRVEWFVPLVASRRTNAAARLLEFLHSMETREERWRRVVMPTRRERARRVAIYEAQFEEIDRRFGDVVDRLSPRQRRVAGSGAKALWNLDTLTPFPSVRAALRWLETKGIVRTRQVLRRACQEGRVCAGYHWAWDKKRAATKRGKAPAASSATAARRASRRRLGTNSTDHTLPLFERRCA